MRKLLLIVSVCLLWTGTALAVPTVWGVNGHTYDAIVGTHTWEAAKTLAEDEEIAFNAGSHSELIKIAYKDFEKCVKPKTVRFSG